MWYEIQIRICENQVIKGVQAQRTPVVASRSVGLWNYSLALGHVSILLHPGIQPLLVSRDTGRPAVANHTVCDVGRGILWIPVMERRREGGRKGGTECAAR